MRKQMTAIVMTLALVFLFFFNNCSGFESGKISDFSSTTSEDVSLPLLRPTFTSINTNILQPKCVACHNATDAQGGVRLDNYTEVIKYINAPAQAETSALYTSVLSGEMPLPPQAALSDLEVITILNWIQNPVD